MKSAFPKWLKRFDPLLEVIEQTNPIYEAFRLRREAYRWGRLPGAAPWMSAITVVLVLLGLILSPVSCCLSLMIPITGIPIVRYHLARKIVRGTGMPVWLDGVFSFEGVHLRAAIDLWLTGVDGRTIAEGIYADRREASWLVTTAVSLVVPMLVLAFGGRLSRNWQELLLAGIPLLYLGFAACYWIHCRAIKIVIREQLEERYHIWKGKPRVREQILRGLRIVVVFWLAYCFCGWGVGGLVDMGAELDRVHGNLGILGGKVRVSWMVLQVFVGLVAMGIHLHCSFTRSEISAEAERAFSVADGVWRAYMRDTVLEGMDREGRS